MLRRRREVPRTTRARTAVLTAGAAAIVAVAAGSVLGASAASVGPSDARCPAPAEQTLRLPDEAGLRDVVTVRPAGPDTAVTPILYLLHGFPGSPDSLRPTAAGLVRAACAAGHRLVVAIPDGRQGSIDTEWGDNTALGLDLETFVTGPVIAAVEGANPRTPSHRIIGGFSMGGFGAAAIGMRHPQLYTRVFSLAGYFHLDDPDHVFGTVQAQRKAHAPDELIRAHSAQRFFLVDGSSDPLALTHPETPRFAHLLHAAHVPVTSYLPSGGHSLAVINAVRDPLLRFLS